MKMKSRNQNLAARKVVQFFKSSVGRVTWTTAESRSLAMVLRSICCHMTCITILEKHFSETHAPVRENDVLKPLRHHLFSC